jgi:hypothetical protein
VRVASTIMEIVGLVAVVAGAYLIDRYLGLMVAGVVLVLVGLALDPVSFLRRAFEQRDLGVGGDAWAVGAMGTGYTVPSNWDAGTTSSGVPGERPFGVGCDHLQRGCAADRGQRSLGCRGTRTASGAASGGGDPQPSLLREPSPEMSVFDWKHMMTVSLLMRGNFYGLVGERDALEYPTIIKPMHPDSVRIDRDPDTFEKAYGSTGERYTGRDLFHIPAFRLPVRTRGCPRSGWPATRWGSVWRRRSTARSGSVTVPRPRRCWRLSKP